MSEESELQKKFDILVGRAQDKQAELRQAREELGGIIARLVDAKPADRADIIERRAELVNLAGILDDEARELESRRDAAELAIYELREALAAAEWQRLDAIARTARQVMNAAGDKLHRHINRNGRAGETEESGRELVRLEVEKARTSAESRIATRNAEKARNLYNQAKSETETCRQRL